MLVRDVMSSPAITVPASTSVRAALRVLDHHGITALPVVDDGTLVGIVSEADLLRETVLPDGRAHMIPVAVADHVPAGCVADVMTTGVVTVSASDDLVNAVDVMTSTMVKSLPVVDDGRVVGVVSRKDVVHLLARRDDNIRTELADLLRSDGTQWLVEVVDGVVQVTGPVGDHERQVAEALAASVPGVVAVRVG